MIGLLPHILNTVVYSFLLKGLRDNNRSMGRSTTVAAVTAATGPAVLVGPGLPDRQLRGLCPICGKAGAELRPASQHIVGSCVAIGALVTRSLSQGPHRPLLPQA